MMDISEFIRKNKKICIIGLGYVGLPLAEVMARKYQIVGFDINSTRISELKAGEDKTNELSSEMLKSAGIEFTDDVKMISKCSLIIVAVPTPIDKFKKVNSLSGCYRRYLYPDTGKRIRIVLEKRFPCRLFPRKSQSWR